MSPSVFVFYSRINWTHYPLIIVVLGVVHLKRGSWLRGVLALSPASESAPFLKQLDSPNTRSVQKKYYSSALLHTHSSPYTAPQKNCL